MPTRRASCTLTDIVSQAAKLGEVAVIEAPAPETAGVNDRAELAERAEVIRQRINQSTSARASPLLHPASTFIDDGVEIGPETVIGPNVSIHGECEIGALVHHRAKARC